MGETFRSLQERFSEHLGYVKNKHLNKVTGEHFNTKGHNHSDMKISIIEKLHSNSAVINIGSRENKCSSLNSTQNTKE